MCIIVDMNTMSAVFKTDDSSHQQFKAIFDHIDCGKSKMIIGGSTYQKELEKVRSLAKLLSEMRRMQKIVIADTDEVDKLEGLIDVAYPSSKYPDFNDKHIVALSYTVNARLVCTIDKPLQKYLKNRDFYNKGKDRPKIFNESSKNNTLPTGSFKPKCKICP